MPDLPPPSKQPRPPLPKLQVRAHAIQLRAARNPNGAVTVFYYPTMDRNAFSLAYAMIEIDATGSVTTQWAKPENLELYDPIRQ